MLTKSSTALSGRQLSKLILYRLGSGSLCVCLLTGVGRCTFSMMLAMVNVLAEPVHTKKGLIFSLFISSTSKGRWPSAGPLEASWKILFKLHEFPLLQAYIISHYLGF